MTVLSLALAACGGGEELPAPQQPGGFGFRLGAGNNDYGKDVAVDAAGNVYATGYIASTVDFDPGTGTSQLQSAGLEDVFVVRFQPDGAYDLAFRLGGLALDGGHRVVVDAAGDILVGGWFRDTTDFDPGAGTAAVKAAGTGGPRTSSWRSTARTVASSGRGRSVGR
jgi:hypothetical protein